MPEKDEVRQAAGDRLLPSSGARWAANVRVVDLLAWIRGGEFGLLLPGSTGDDGLETLRRLNAATHKLRSFSAGLAEWASGETGAEVVARADGHERTRRARRSARAGERLAPQTMTPELKRIQK